MKKNKTANDWLGLMMESSGSCGKPEDVPDGWLTLKDMQDQTGLPESTMYGRVQKWLRQGLLDKKQFRIRRGQQVAPVWHFIKK